MGPDILHLILCDGVQTDPNSYHRFNVLGLTTAIRSSATPPFPVVRPLFVALVVWTGGRGVGDLTLQIVEDCSGSAVFRTTPRQVRFVGDPAAIGGVVFHIRNCSFRAAGLYWAQVVFAGSVIARQRLFLRA
jgi:hypothetical protein